MRGRASIATGRLPLRRTSGSRTGRGVVWMTQRCRQSAPESAELVASVIGNIIEGPKQPLHTTCFSSTSLFSPLPSSFPWARITRRTARTRVRRRRRSMKCPGTELRRTRGPMTRVWKPLSITKVFRTSGSRRRRHDDDACGGPRGPPQAPLRKRLREEQTKTRADTMFTCKIIWHTCMR